MDDVGPQGSLFEETSVPAAGPLESLIERWLLGCRADICDALGVCESEIEKEFAVTLLSAADAKGPFLRLTDRSAQGGKCAWAKGRAGILYAQYPHKLAAKSIRIDFVLMASNGKRFAVETDGFKEHHSTPAKVAEDAARDQALSEEGWDVIRFPGRQVRRDPDGCAAHLLRRAGMTPGKPAPRIIVAACAPAPRREPPMSLAAGARIVLDALNNPGRQPRRQ